MARLFGTDGVRGVANDELTPLLAMQLGQAGAYVLSKENAHKPTIMVGCDTRISGDMLANALMAGACSVGANVVYVGGSRYRRCSRTAVRTHPCLPSRSAPKIRAAPRSRARNAPVSQHLPTTS